MQEWIDQNGFEDRNALIRYANALVMKYGGTAGALACIMYEKTAEAQGKNVKTAEIAELPSYGEVAKAINGTMKETVKKVPSTVGRLTKQVGADTTIKNGIRDGAQFAWVPGGAETCAFCITLASRGWQYMSKKALKNGHAEHIHAGCDCQYAVRFDGTSNVEGYDPDKYLQMYENAEGTRSDAKIRALRRQLYAEKNGLKLDDEGYAIRNSSISFNKLGDPIYDIFGVAEESHPEDIERIINKAKNLHVEVREKEGKMAYSPGLRKGEPGQLFISKSDSIGAWLHEERHMLDDEADGFPGFEGLFDVERRTRMEYNAYKVEIDLARKNNREDIAQQLIELCRREIEGFGGEWDEKRLE